MPPPGGGGKRGRDTKVSLPLLTPQPFLRTRLPSVARLNARGPQGRLVLQGSTLDGSGAFRSAKQAPCTVSPPGGEGVSVPTDRGKRGQDTKHGFLSPLDSPTFPWDATPFGRASKCEGPTGTFGAPRYNA